MTTKMYSFSRHLVLPLLGFASLVGEGAHGAVNCQFTCSGFFKKTAGITCKYRGTYKPYATWTGTTAGSKTITRSCDGQSSIGTSYGSDDFASKSIEFCRTVAECPSQISQVKGYRETEQVVTLSLVSCDQGSEPVCKNNPSKPHTGTGDPHAAKGDVKSGTNH